MKCKLFYCARIKAQYCCTHCAMQSKCSYRCLNSPDRCGQAIEEESRKAPCRIKEKALED